MNTVSAFIISKPNWYHPSSPNSTSIVEPPLSEESSREIDKTNSRRLQHSCELLTSFFHDLQRFMLTNVRGVHTVSLASQTSIRVAFKLLRSPSRYPSTAQTRDALACIEEVGRLPAILYLAVLIRDYLKQPVIYHSAIQEVNDALQSTEDAWHGSIMLLRIVLFHGRGWIYTAPTLDRAVYVLNIMEAAKQLSWKSWIRLKETLLAILATLLDDAVPNQSVFIATELLDSGQLLKEIRKASWSSRSGRGQYPCSDETESWAAKFGLRTFDVRAIGPDSSNDKPSLT
jgi:hypothetical protein